MKVLFVASGKPRFGAAPFIKSQGESLKNNGIDLDFFLIKEKGFWGYLKNIRKLKHHLKTNRYDLIHAHYGLCGWVSILTLTTIPKIVSFMGDDLLGDADEKGRKKFSDNFFIFANKLLQLFIAFIIVKSNNLAECILNKSKMQIIPNGIDFELFIPMDKETAAGKLFLKVEKNKKYILFLGNKKITRKNFPLLKNAVVGFKDIELLTPYPIDHAQVPLYLNLADILVLTSYKEGSPNVIKEAMACNCPIVSTDVGDAKEVIGNTKGCYIVSFDPKDVASKIREALQFGRRTNGRENIEHLEINVIAKRIIKIYETVAAERKPYD